MHHTWVDSDFFLLLQTGFGASDHAFISFKFRWIGLQCTTSSLFMKAHVNGRQRLQKFIMSLNFVKRCSEEEKKCIQVARCVIDLVKYCWSRRCICKYSAELGSWCIPVVQWPKHWCLYFLLSHPCYYYSNNIILLLQ